MLSRLIERGTLEEAVRRAASAGEAGKKLGISRVSVYRMMKRLEIRPPNAWSARRLEALETMRRRIPEPVIVRMEDRAWVAGLIGGDGSLRAPYDGNRDATRLVVGVNMTDPAWVFRFSDICRVPRPHKPRPPAKRAKKNVWVKHITGLRALRVTREILPFLVGSKKIEAERAIEFFSPGGFHPGRFSGFDIWTTAEFPLRIRRLAQVSYPQASRERGE